MIIRMRYLFLIPIVIINGCASKDEQFPPVEEDYCSQLTPSHFNGLSDQLAGISDSLFSKTGVYLLEEGDVSMVFRAWLSESAQKSIDVQYFIFSSDNVGLIAVGYLLRAADRGVKVRLIVDDFMVEADRGFHAKSMVVDEKISVVATFNLDPRSANLNTECITIVHDPIISAKLSRVIAKELEIENAWHVTKDFNPDKEAGRGKRINLWFRGVVHKSIL